MNFSVPMINDFYIFFGWLCYGSLWLNCCVWWHIISIINSCKVCAYYIIIRIIVLLLWVYIQRLYILMWRSEVLLGAVDSPAHGRRKQGRQRLLYPKYIGRLVSPDFLLSWLEIRRIAQDRREWEKLVSACCAADWWWWPLNSAPQPSPLCWAVMAFFYNISPML